MTSFDDSWYLAQEADQAAEQALHHVESTYDDFVEFRRRDHVSRGRFRDLAHRIRETGAPYGAHTIVHRPDDHVLLVYHEGVDLWVLPGGGVKDGESFLETARRELDEEAGVDAAYEGLATLTRVVVESDADHRTWGVIPTFEARAETYEPEIDDPSDEISAAEWYPVSDLPQDTRERHELREWWTERRE